MIAKLKAAWRRIWRWLRPPAPVVAPLPSPPITDMNTLMREAAARLPEISNEYEKLSADLNSKWVPAWDGRPTPYMIPQMTKEEWSKHRATGK